MARTENYRGHKIKFELRKHISIAHLPKQKFEKQLENFKKLLIKFKTIGIAGLLKKGSYNYLSRNTKAACYRANLFEPALMQRYRKFAAEMGHDDMVR